MSTFLSKHRAEKGSPRQQKLWERAYQLGLPEKKAEAFQYVPLSLLYEKEFAFPTRIQSTLSPPADFFPECRGSTLFFINGIFYPELSESKNLPSSLLILSLSEAEKKFEVFFKGRIDQLFEEEKDPFALLNYAHYQEGIFLYLPPQLSLERPLQILSLYTQDEPLLFSPRLHLLMGKESRLNLYLSEHFLREPTGWINGGMDIVLEPGAALSLYSLPRQSATMFHTEAIRATLKRESSLSTVTLSRGKKIFRQEISCSLERGARATLHGASLLDQKRESHIHTLVEHKEEGASSFQKFKNVLEGQSRTSFTGKIHVHSEAQKTEAYQINNNLVLNSLARAYSKPNLTIFADDVKASHGATVGKLDKEALFYLKSKGIGDQMAKQLLVRGFYREITNLIPFYYESF